MFAPTRVVWIAFVLLFPVLVGLVQPVAAATGTVQAPDAAPADSTSDLEADRDTFVSSDQPDSNFGSDARLFVGQAATFGATRSLVQFDMGGLDKREAVTDAKLRMYMRGAGPSGDPGRDIVIYRVRDGWDEGGATWNNFPDYDDSRLDSTSIGTSSSWYEWDLDDLTRAWRWPSWQSDSEENRGLYVQGYEAGGSYRQFDSRNGSNSPVLRIQHVTDTVPPHSALSGLPPYFNVADPQNPGTARIPLSWTFEDPTPATGVDFLRLYYQRNDEAWALYHDRLQRYDDTFQGENGRRYGFAVYAVDVAGNVEAAKPAEAQTLVDFSPPTTSINALPQWINGPITVSWTGQDQPVGPGLFPSGIASYSLYYNIGGGSWANIVENTTATSAPFQPQGEYSYQFMVLARDLAGNSMPVGAAQAQTMADLTAPVVTFNPLTGIDNKDFVVSWSGNDFGRSGVVSYDIQFRRNLDPWQDWVTGSQQTLLGFEGEFSNTYSFRGRARDVAGNVGAYPTEPQLTVGVIRRDLLRFAIDFPQVSASAELGR